jgi:hypothetical protein
MAAFLETLSLLSLPVQLLSLYFLLLLQKKVANLPAGRQGKAEPILMRNLSSLNHYSAKIGR